MGNDLQKQFLQFYTQEFPEKEQVHISSCTSIGNGWESDLFALHLEYEEAAKQRSEDVVLKMYHGQVGSQKAQNETHGMKQLAYGGYPVPRVLFMALQDSPFGQACLAMERIEGDTLTRVFNESAKEKRHELITLFCQLYVGLHNLDWQALVPNAGSYQTDGIIASWVANRLPFIEQVLPGVFDSVIAWVQARSGEIVSQRLSIIHGDFHPNNILLRDDRATFVIDWTNIGISDYRFDLAWTLLLLSTEWAIELRDIVLKEYERVAGQTVEHIEFFDVISCTRRLFDITASLSSGAATLGMRPDAEPEMRGKVKQIRAIYTQLQEITGCTLPEIERLIVSLSS